MRPRFLVLGSLLAGRLFAVKPVSRILYRISHPLASLELADAVGRGDNATIAFMLDQGVPVDYPGLLGTAADQGHLSTVELLLARGAPDKDPGQ